MMPGLGRALAALLTAAVVCAVAESLMPPGPVQAVGRLVCGLVLVWVVLGMVTGREPSPDDGWMEGWLEQVEDTGSQLKERVTGEMKEIIAAELAAYIGDKGAELGVTCRVEVTCREENGLWLPHSVRVTGNLGPEEREKLAALVVRDLAVPREQITFSDGEGAP